MGRSTGWLLCASLALCACEPVEPPQESPEAAVSATKASPLLSYWDEDGHETFWHEALSLDAAGLARDREAALVGDHRRFERHLHVLFIRGDADATRALWQPVIERGNEELFGLFANVMLELATGEPQLLYRLAADAHAAGFSKALLHLAHLAGADQFAVDDFDRMRIGELVQSLDASPTFESALGLAELYTTGMPELGIAADPKKAIELYESAANAGDGEQAMIIARAFRNGHTVPRDVRRAHALYAHAGDKGAAYGHNDAAWIATTCPGFTAQEHRRALSLVEQNIAEHGEDSANIDTLAAVYARLGQYEQAVAAQIYATTLLQSTDGNTDRRAEFDARLALYQQRRAYDTPDC